jgi:DNA topoisomerase VI subunit B
MKAARFEQAKSSSPKPQNFTNPGKADNQETPAGRAKQKKLTRVPFTVSRLMEFCTRKELVNQTGHDYPEWPLVVLKELVDNAVDACEEAGIAPVISVTVEPGSIVIEDNGPGIPAKTIDGVLDYNVRVSSREAYVSPTRGAQGNALKTILPMAYVLDERHGENACGKTTIEAHGIAHHIEFSVNHIRLEPKITHTTTPSPVVVGTKVTVRMAQPLWRTTVNTFAADIVGASEREFLRLANEYVWINPHLSLKVVWVGEVKIDFQASNPAWKKWLPSWPTSAHWYDKSRFRRYMAAHIANHESITVREFITEFDGMSGTAKQKAVLAATGASRVKLYDFFGRHKINSANVEKLLAALKRHTKPVKTAALGVIGKDHLFRMMEAAGGEPKTFTYGVDQFETDGVPHVVEFAFGIKKVGLTASPRVHSRTTVTGVNCSPGIRNPFQQIGRNGAGLDTMLSDLNASSTEPAIVVLHLICPRVTYTDRGKSAIVIEGESKEEKTDYNEEE